MPRTLRVHYKVTAPLWLLCDDNKWQREEGGAGESEADGSGR